MKSEFRAIGGYVWKLAAWALLVAGGLLAQVPVGSIEGTVSDPTGATLAGAKVSIKNDGTNQTINVTTTGAGLYSQRNLDPGTYTVDVEAQGFSSGRIANIKVSGGQVVNGSLTLQVGKSSSVVEVAAQAVAVDTTRQTVDSVITQQEITSLPLFSRNFLDLAVLTPGTTVRDGGTIDPTKSNTYRTVGIAGRSGTATRVQLDGVDITDETVGTTVGNISQDAVQEFQLQRSSLDISTSLTSSGAISIVSRSGSNDIHGTGFFDYTNNDMAARLNYDALVPDTNRKRYGVGAGGPLIRNKMFVYGNLEKSSQLNGQFGSIPLFPQYSYSASLPLTYQYAFGKLDYNISNSVRFFYEFNHSDDLSTGGTAISPYQNVDRTNVNVAGLTYSTARFTNNFRFGLTNFNNHIDSSQLSAYPFPNLGGYPYQLNIQNVSAGPNGLAPQQTFQRNYQGSYEGSLVVKSHTLRFGADIRSIGLGGFANFAGPLSVTLEYDAQTVADLQAKGLDIRNPLNYPLTDFSTGPNAGYFTVRPGFGLPHGGHFDTRTGIYGQDSWKVTPNFTLNLGVRWQYDTDYFSDPNVPRDPIFNYWIPGASKSPSFPKDKFSPSVGFTWDPFKKGKDVIRGGFYRAYEMNIFNNILFDEYASIPSGIGPDTYSSAGVNGPDGTPVNVNNHPTGSYTDLQGQPLSAVLPTIVNVDQALKTAYTSTPYNPNKGFQYDAFQNTKGLTYGGVFPGDQFKLPYSLQWNIGFQHELKPGLVVTADFVYNHGVGLPLTLEDFDRRKDARYYNVSALQAKLNSVLKGQTVDQYIASHSNARISDFALVNDTTFPGLNPNYLRARFITGGFSSYRALQATLRGNLGDFWKFKGNFFNIAYALSSDMSTGTGSNRGEFVASALNNNNPNQGNYFGFTSLDHLHSLTVSNISTLPGGFRINTITSFTTPGPLNVSVPNFGGATGGTNSLFANDINGDGGYTDLIPGIDYNKFGRSVKTFSVLNEYIARFNSVYAGRFTPAAQDLINAGLFTPAQLTQLGATIKAIPLVPASAPNPFHNTFTTNLRLDRPVKLFNERLNVIPYADIINLFNHAPANSYSGLGASFGSFNFDYTQPGASAPDLASQVGRNTDTRRVQVGIRAEF